MAGPHALLRHRLTAARRRPPDGGAPSAAPPWDPWTTTGSGLPSHRGADDLLRGLGPRGARFAAVVAFSSLHWIDPQLRYAKPADLLEPGGAMVVGGCLWAQPAGGGQFWTDVQQDYRAVGYEGDPPPPPEQIGPWHFPAEAGAFFDEVASFRYPFSVIYSPEDYLAILASQSGTRALGQARSADFLARVRARLESLGSPPLTATFVGHLTVARRTSDPL